MEEGQKKIGKGGYGQIRMEVAFKRSLVAIAIVMVLLVLAFFVTLVVQSVPSIRALGIQYLWGKTWDPVNNVYGALPFIVGTLLTSFAALIISIPFSFAIAVYLGEYKPQGWLSNFLKNTVDLIAAVPSVIYGFWGLLVLVPKIQDFETAWNNQRLSEYRAINKDDNSFTLNGKALALNVDYFPLAYSGAATVEGALVNDGAVLPDSTTQGHPWVFDIKPMLQANANKPGVNIHSAIKQAALRYLAKGAGAIVVVNSAAGEGSVQFDPKDTSSPLDIPVLFITANGYNKYFTGPTPNASIAITADVEVVDPYEIPPYGIGILTASLILAIMIIPYAASMGRELIRMVPSSLKEGAYALGATRQEVIKSVILPYTKSGLFAGVLLSLGRALGETMAVTMVIGNSPIMPKSIFSLGHTMASVIANEFAEADHSVYLSALVELGLVLFLVTVAINMIGKGLIKRFTHE